MSQLLDQLRVETKLRAVSLLLTPIGNFGFVVPSFLGIFALKFVL